MAKVIVIPPKEKETERLRVAAYCRVSSHSADQLHSHAAQIRSYTEQIKQQDGWELVDIYADEGLTGTRMEQRDEFNRMMADCRKGRIDRILVKSLSRFARNTRDCLASLRELSSLGVTVKFEKENIDTGTLTSELLISVFGSLAQQESVSISQNQRMSYQRRMEKGEFITCSAPFGYRLTDGKDLEIVEEEAVVVRWIFDSYLDGKSIPQLIKELTKKEIRLRSDVWHPWAVRKILLNEKYIGDALCQKTYTTSSFPYTRKDNRGEADQYYVEHTHPPIIDRDTFKKVQTLMQWRANREVKPRTAYPLSQKIRCKVCGAVFVRRVTARGTAWLCRNHDLKASSCPVGRIPEQEIYAAFLRMYNKLKVHGGIILQPALSQLDGLAEAMNRSNPTMLALNQSIAQTTEKCYKVAKLQTSGVIDADACAAKMNTLHIRLAELRAKRKRLLKTDDISEQAAEIKRTVNRIADGPDRLETLNPELFADLVEKIIAESQTTIRFLLYGGITVTERVKGAGR